MEPIDKARIKLEHWIAHNDNHRDEYQRFARELEEMGETQSADHVRAMVDLAQKSNDCLRKALRALEA